jgi:hypothetical protein
MSGMGRRMFTIFAAVGLVLGVIVLAGTSGRYGSTHVFGVKQGEGTGGCEWIMGVDRSGVFVGRMASPYMHPTSGLFFRGLPFVDPHRQFFDQLPRNEYVRFLGIVGLKSRSTDIRYLGLLVPPWLVIVIFSMPALVWWRLHRGRWRREARKRAGLCPACGYDLRASTGRCPECGAMA